MTTTIFPEQNISLIADQNIVGTALTKVLFVGQKLIAGSAPAGDLVENIGVAKEEDGLFAIDSMLAAMVRGARALNKNTRFDAIPLDDDGGASAAEGTITATGTATAAGTFDVISGSIINHKLTISVAIGDTEAVVAASIVTSVTADTSIPVTAANVLGVVTLTAKNGGTVGNGIGLEVSGSVAGITLVRVKMAGGTTDPSLTNVFDVISEERYQHIIWPDNYDLTVVKTLLDGRFNINKRVLDGVAIIGKFDTFANINALVLAENSQSLNFVGNELIDTSLKTAGVIFELPYVVGASDGALRALRLTTGANIANLVTSPSPLDRFGGTRLSSLPYANTPISTLPLIDVGQGFSDTEVDTLTANGFSVLGNNKSRTSITMGQMVTTYKTDNAGNPDTTFKFLNFVDTEVAAREIIFNNNDIRFGQTRLTEGTASAGVDNVETIRAFNNSIYAILGNEENLLVPTGPEAAAFFNANMTVLVDLSTGLITITEKLPLITQARQINQIITIVFSIQT